MAKTKNYLNKKDLLEEIYKSREQDKLTRKCLEMLMLLAQKTIKGLYYKCEDDKQHALSEAYFDLSKNWKKFDPDFARYHGYENLKEGDEIRVNPVKNSDRTAAAVVVENFPLKPILDEEINLLKKEKCTDISFKMTNQNKKLTIYFLPKGFRQPKSKLRKKDYSTKILDISKLDRIKLEYIVKKNKKDIRMFDREDVIIKDPNPFSFFTSACINGYAKGWKRLYPKKTKGLLLSLDSGFDTEGDGMHNF